MHVGVDGKQTFRLGVENEPALQQKNLHARFGISLAIYRGQKASPWETPKKSEKGFPGPLGPGDKKDLKQSRK